MATQECVALWSRPRSSLDAVWASGPPCWLRPPPGDGGWERPVSARVVSELPTNLSATEPAIAIVARNDPHEQEHVEVLEPPVAP